MASLLDDIETFMARHSVSATYFGLHSLNDRHLVKQLRNGRRMWPETEARIRDFMASFEKQAA